MSNYNELYHYGIPGMKWGVRRRSDDTATSSGTPRRKGIDKRKLARNIAIGVGTAAAIGGAAYGIHRLRKSGKMPNLRKLNGPTPLRIADKMNNQYDDKTKKAYKEFLYLNKGKKGGDRLVGGFDGNSDEAKAYRDSLYDLYQMRTRAQRKDLAQDLGVLAGSVAAYKTVKAVKNRKRNTKR